MTMEHRRLGSTSLDISRIAFGTAEVGMDYGIPVPGKYAQPGAKDALKTLSAALDCGISLFDTAPGYGPSEDLLGQLDRKEEWHVATKVALTPAGEDTARFVRRSVEQSLKNLRRDALDIVQIHNATAETVSRSDMFDVLWRLKEAGAIRHVGASVYEPANAAACILSGRCEVLQIAYNILDQRMRCEVMPLARAHGVGVLVRSVYMRGVLTPRFKHLDTRFAPLTNAVESIMRTAQITETERLPAHALRFCLAASDIDSVILGIRDSAELQAALRAASQGPLQSEMVAALQACALSDPYWLDPSNWPRN